MILIGIDIGTTGSKVVAYLDNGIALETTYIEHKLKTDGVFVELDSEKVFSNILLCIRKVMKNLNKRDVLAISVSAMSDTFTPIGFNGRPLMDSIVSFDKRAIEEANELERKFGRNELYRITGLPIHSMFPACKLLWAKRHSSHIMQKTWKYLCYEAFVLWKLGGEAATSYSMAGKSMLFENSTKDWSDLLLDECGVQRNQLPILCESGVCVGTVSPEIAELTGLTTKTKLVTGGFDQACCALACGVLDLGDLLDTTGTNEIVYFMTKKESMGKLLENNMMFSYHVKPNSFSSYAHIINAGGAFRWCRDSFFGASKANVVDIYDYMTANCSDQPNDIFFFPFLAGMGTPEMDPNIKGGFWGLDLNTNTYSIAQAVLEGVNFEFKNNIELINQMYHKDVHEMVSVGGASKSDYWVQLKADISGLRIKIPVGLEAGACGAAILAGIGCGLYSDVYQGVSAFQNSIKYKIVLPNKQNRELFDKKYDKYKKMRNMIKSFPQ